MLRFNTGKAPLALIPTSFTEVFIKFKLPTDLYWEVARVLDFGAKKYSAHNWRKGGSWTSVLNSMLRHLLLIIEGEQFDPESGLSHYGHLGCNLAFLLEFMATETGQDDRYKVDQKIEDRKWIDGRIILWSELLRWQNGGGREALEAAICQAAKLFAKRTEPSPTQIPLDLPEVDQIPITSAFGETLGYVAKPAGFPKVNPNFAPLH